MRFATLSLAFLAIVTSTKAAPQPVVTPADFLQARQIFGDSIGDSISSEIAGRMSSISSAAQDRASSFSNAAASRSSSLDAAASSRASSLSSAAVSRSSSIASVTLNHPTQAFSSGGSDCNGSGIIIGGSSFDGNKCCSGPIINNKCYNTSSTINGGTQTPTSTPSSNSNSDSDDANSNDNANSDSNSDSSDHSGNDDNSGVSIAQPAAMLLGLIGGASFLLL